MSMVFPKLNSMFSGGWSTGLHRCIDVGRPYFFVVRLQSGIPPLQQAAIATPIQQIVATPKPALKPISASIRSNVTNVSSIQKLCCRKGCLKCVDTPSYRERTVGSATRRR
jgi:hypothetical protein